MSTTDPNWINFEDAPPRLRFVNVGGDEGDERCCLYRPESDGEAWIAAREQDFVGVEGNL